MKRGVLILNLNISICKLGSARMSKVYDSLAKQSNYQWSLFFLRVPVYLFLCLKCECKNNQKVQNFGFALMK